MRITTSPTKTDHRSANPLAGFDWAKESPAQAQGSGQRHAESRGRRLKNLGKRQLRRLFEGVQRCGFDLLPRHLYSQVPDIRELRADDSWKAPRTMIGVQGSELATQFDFVETCCPPKTIERLGQNDVHALACEINGEAGFGVPDTEFLYSFIRTIQPKKIMQVGCGVSTAVMLVAAAEAHYQPEIVCVEPYPTEFLVRADRDRAIRLVKARAQDVPLTTLTDLGDEGFLFVDSTHTVKPGSEVNRLVLEVLPRLSAGDWVHFHDIYFPYDYQRGLLEDELFFSSESVLLHAFLIYNRSFAIRAALSMLHFGDRERLERLLPHYRPARDDHGLRKSAGHFPGSTYLQVCDG
jgi:Methyltransferase domain